MEPLRLPHGIVAVFVVLLIIAVIRAIMIKAKLPEKAVFAGKKRIRNVRQYARELASAYAMHDAI